MTAALEVAGLRILGPAGEVLVQDASVMARPGLPLTLLGETGSGKSLVLQAIMGTLPGGLRASGRIMLDGMELLAASAAARRALWGRRIAILPQEPGLALDPTMRSLAQVAEVYRLVRGLPGPEALAEAQARLAELGLGQASDLYPFQLSGGMAQRLALAILRASAAPVVLADEPTKGLDAARRDEIARHLREAAEQGATMLVVTHDVAVARSLGGTVAVMREGVVVEQGPAATVLARPFHDYPRQLLAAEPAAWTMPRPRAVAGAVPQGDAVLEGRGLSKGFAGQPVLRGVDLTLRRGELVAVLGPSGCGKTTLGDLLLGLLRPDGGVVHRAPGLAPWRFQKLYQDPPSAFAPRQTMRQALRDLGRLHGIAWAAFEALAERLRLAPVLFDRRPDAMSGGELQRFAILRALAVEPVFLFADEPTSRLDPLTQQEVAMHLRELVSERNLSLLLVTHDAAIARTLADRVIRLDQGRVHEPQAQSSGQHPGREPSRPGPCSA